MHLNLQSAGMREARVPAVISAIAAEVKFRRGNLKISQEELAHRAGVNRSFIAKIEVAKTQTSIAVLFRLADALEIDVTVLVAGIAHRYREGSGALALPSSNSQKKA